MLFRSLRPVGQLDRRLAERTQRRDPARRIAAHLAAEPRGIPSPPIPALQGVVEAATADRFTLALGSDGLARGTGANETGSLGDGGSTARNTFGAVSTLSDAISVSAGGRSFSGAVTSSGATFMWGDNAAKQLGNTAITSGSTATPTAVPNFDAIP